MAQKVEIEVVATDSASTKLSNIANVVTGISSAINIAQNMFGTMQRVMDATVNVAQDYNQQVRDMMLATGGTAEETSKLVQVIDDVGISYETLKTAMKMASKDGIEPNLESLAQLADQYNKLAPGVERNQFLLDKFGRSGLDMARAMEQGGAALRQMSDEMGGSLVLTEENIKASEEYRKNLDEMQDTVMGLKVALGNALIPALNDTIDAYQNSSEALKDNFKWYEYIIPAIHGARMAYELYRGAQRDGNEEAWAAADAIAAHGDALMNDTQAIEANTTAMQAQEATMQNFMANAMWLTSNQEDYNQSMRDLNNERAREMATLMELEKQYGAQNAKVDEQKQKIGELDAKIKDLQTTQKEQTDQWVLKLMEQNGASVEMQMAYAEASGLITTKAAEQVTAIGTVVDQFDTGKQMTREYRDYVQKLISRIMALDGLQATADIYINTYGEVPRFGPGGGESGTHFVGGAGKGAGTLIGDGYDGERAVGGPVRAGGSYLVGERGMELFTPTTNGFITPNNALGGMTVNLTYAPMFSTANRSEFLQNITPMLDDWYRRRLAS